MIKLKGVTPALTIAISGHRPAKLPGQGELNNPEAQEFFGVVRQQLSSAIFLGRNTFLHGGCSGFDIICMEQIIFLKERYPHIKYITVAPFRKDYFAKTWWTPEWVERAKNVFSKHNGSFVLEHEYRKGIYYDRNKVLIDNCSELICYCADEKSGAGFTKNYAEQKNIRVRNIFTGGH